MMATDAYARLGLPVRLALDPAVVRARLQELAKTQHPDAGGSAEAYAEIAGAAALLSDPARRLGHWAELHGWRLDGNAVAIDEGLAEMFTRVAGKLEDARNALAAAGCAKSALAKAVAERAKMQCVAALDALLEEIGAQLRQADGELTVLDGTRPDPAAVAALGRRYAWLQRWQALVRETLARLAG